MDRVQKNNFLAMYSIFADFHAEDKHCDTTIQVEDEVFKCHSLLLAAVSEYFDVMYGGSFKEGKRTDDGKNEPIVLHELDASAFKAVLQFLYRGKIQVTDTNVHTLLYTSDFLRLRITYIEEECMKFLRNSAKPVSNALEILRLACVTGKQVLVELAGVHILKHFAHFSKGKQFLEMPFECLDAVLKSKQLLSTNTEDVLLRTIYHWINYSREERKQHRDNLMKNIDLSKISCPYLKSLLQVYENFVDHVTLNKGVECAEPAIFDAYPLPEGEDDIEVCETHLHVFTKSTYRNKHKVRIFSTQNAVEWSLATEFDCTSTSMRNVVLDNTLYCLGFYWPDTPYFRNNLPTGNIFTTHESISASAKHHLRNPPIMMSRYELCGLQNNIYVYNKSIFQAEEVLINGGSSSDESLFSPEELQRNIFRYDRELDKWFSIPSIPPQNVIHQDVSSLVVANNTLHFVGGESDSGCFRIHVYDSRTSKWGKLPGGHPTNFNLPYYKQIQCCANQNNIYVASFGRHQIDVYTFDLLAAKWRIDPIISLGSNNRYGYAKFLPYKNELWFIPASRPFNFDFYDTVTQEITVNSWSLEEASRRFGKCSHVLDAVVF